jgi:hypothetical protein
MDNLTEEEFQEHVRQLFYKPASKEVGSRADEAFYNSKHGINGLFTTHLADSGMWRNNGLNT